MIMTVDKRSPVESTPISFYPRWHGLFAIADVDAPWGIAARMSVALALVARWTGALAGSPAIIAGVARFVARDVLLSSGTMTTNEYADEINGEIAATVFADKNPDLGAIARAALDASRADAAIRQSSKNARSMSRVIGEWLNRHQVVAKKDLDDAAGASPQSGDLASDVFGKCFTRGPTRFDELDVGFDEPKTRETGRLSGVHGAAQKAGLGEGDTVVSIRYDEGQAEHPIRVVVERTGQKVEVRYRPIGRSKTAQGFRVVPGIDPSTCGHP
jgi:hypothetical protein